MASYRSHYQALRTTKPTQPQTLYFICGSDGFLKIQINLTNPGCLLEASHCTSQDAEQISQSVPVQPALSPTAVRAKGLSEFSAMKQDS